ISGYGGEAVLRSFDCVRELNSGGEPAESKRQTKTPPEELSSIFARSGYIPIVYKPACTYEQNSIKYS
ncbi:UNVERIFIED_CONTAM: hypothetical protein FO527_30015, partial [Bacillus sp. ATCC 13368]